MKISGAVNRCFISQNANREGLPQPVLGAGGAVFLGLLKALPLISVSARSPRVLAMVRPSSGNQNQRRLDQLKEQLRTTNKDIQNRQRELTRAIRERDNIYRSFANHPIVRRLNSERRNLSLIWRNPFLLPHQRARIATRIVEINRQLSPYEQQKKQQLSGPLAEIQLKRIALNNLQQTKRRLKSEIRNLERQTRTHQPLQRRHTHHHHRRRS